jgi:hypothetical protein
MISFREFITEDAPVNSGFGGPGIAKYDPLLDLSGGKKKKMLRRPRPKSTFSPPPVVTRVAGMASGAGAGNSP